jgi:protein gp37
MATDALVVTTPATTVASERSLEELEDIIDRGLGAFLAVGHALTEIRRRKRYVERGFDTFEEYCEKWLEIAWQRGYQFCDAAEIDVTLSTKVEKALPRPIRETHFRALVPLKKEPERLRAAWQEAVTTATNGTRLTATHISAVVDRHLPKPPPKFYTVADWLALDDDGRAAALLRRDSKHRFNEQTNESIGWAQWSWNPVTGCLHGCAYCYARDIAARYYDQGFAPAFLPDRLAAPQTTRVPEQAKRDVAFRNVFTCSMSDLFGRWVPADWIDAVLEQVSANPQWNFLFLTKFPVRLQEFIFPDNAWVGTTVDAQARVKNAERAFARVQAKVKWLSCEPLLEPLRFEHLDLFQWVVLGGASQSSETPEWRPPRTWVDDLERQAREARCRLYEKANLLELHSEYPGQAPRPRLAVPDAFKMPYLQRDVLEPEAYAAEVAVE